MTDKLNFTPSQRLAMDISQQKNVLVSASAGTGKTTVMVERIKRLVEEKRIPLNKMLVITFTRLAAAEMKEKLFNKLSSSDDEFARSQSERVEECTIGTIHSFCAETVREYFYVLGIDPNFAMLTGGEEQKLFDRAVESVFERRYHLDSDLADAVEKFCFDREDQTLRENVKKLHVFFGCVEDLLLWHQKTQKENSLQKIKEFFNENFIEKTTQLKENLSCLLQLMGEANANAYVERLEKIRTSLTGTNDKQDLCANLQSLSLVKIPSRKQNMAEEMTCEPSWKETLLQAEKEITNAVNKLVSDAKIILNALQKETKEKEGESFCDFCILLASEVEKEFAKYKKEKNLLDFSDLEKMTLAVLRDSYAREQIKNRYDCVFVDEYQDVNGIQEEIIKLVAKDNSLFVVGDVKQSIYGFRLADPDIFASKTKQYETDMQNDTVVYMNDNFRCNAQIAEFVNKTFSPAMTEKFGSVDYSCTGELVAQSNCKICDGKPAVEIFALTEKGKTKEEDLTGAYDLLSAQCKKTKDSTEGRFVAKKIKELLSTQKEDGKTVTYGDIVILCRSLRSNALDIYKELVNAGIPTVINTEGEVNNKEIGDLLAFFKTIDNCFDDYALAQTMLSPVGGFDEQDLATVAQNNSRSYLWKKLDFYCQNGADESLVCKCREFVAKIKKYADLRFVLKAGRLLLLLMEEVEYERFVLALPNGQMRVMRLFSFVSAVGDMTVEEVLQASFSEEDFSCAPSDGDAVRIMTIHASKGLEFDVVFLCSLDYGFGNKRQTGNILLNKNCGIAICRTEEKTLRELFVSQANKKKEKEEELRLLYVAMTRAKRKLFCVVEKEKDTGYLFRDQSEAERFADWLTVDEQSDCFLHTTLSVQDLLQESSDTLLQQKDLSPVSEELKERYLQACEWQYHRKEQLDLPLKVVSSKLDESIYVRGEDFAEEKQTVQPVYLASVEEEKEDLGKTTVDKTQLGKAYHKIFERCDLRNDTKESLQKTVDILLAEGWFDQKTANEIDFDLLSNALNSPDFAELIEGGKLYREIPFLTTLPYSQLFGEGLEEEIMLQGVVDLLVLRGEEALVVDFKVTGRSDKIRERYQKQLNSYKLAVEKCLKIPAQAVVFSVLDGKVIRF